MAQVLPPNRQELKSGDRKVWHDIMRPSWETLISVGYVDQARVIQAQSASLLLSLVDGEVNMDGTGGTFLQKALIEAGEECWAVSTDAGDTQTLVVQGVGDDGLVKQAVFTLTGTTRLSIGNWKNINSMIVTTTLNVGDVFASTRDATGTPVAATDSIQCKIQIGNGLAVNSMQMIASNEVGVLTQLSAQVTCPTNPSCVGAIRVKSFQFGIWFQTLEVQISDGQYSQEFTVPRVLPSNIRIAFTGQTIEANLTAFTFQSEMYAMQADNNHSPPIVSV